MRNPQSLDGPDLLVEARAETMATPVDAATLYDLCREIDNRIARADTMIGLLPVEAVDVLAQGLAQVAVTGHAEAWIRLGRCHRQWTVEPRFDWPSAPPFPALDAEPSGRELRCYAEAAALGDRLGATLFASASRHASEDAKRAALTLLDPFLVEDPDGTTTYWYGITQHSLGEASSAVATQHRAAERGNADAMFELYVLYVKGLGVTRNDSIAHEWLVRAAGQEHPRALYNVAAGHATGSGFPKDNALAARYYERAADAGNAQAAATVGCMHLIGEGVPANPTEAARWFDLAEEDGFDVDGWLELLGLERPGR